MKRFGAVLATAVAWTVLTLGGAPAQARDVSSKHVEQTRGAVVSYWTSARMRSARPVPLAKPGSPAGGGKSKPGTATEVPAPYTTFPTSTNGKVFFTDNGVNYVCSGTAITSANQSVVWTAGHCVNEGPGSFYTNWAFVPAYRDGARPYGTWPASSLHTTTQWSTSGDFSYDLGAAVAAPAATRLTAAIGGGRSLTFNGSRSQTYNAFGYPQASPFNGLRLWTCASGLYMSDTSASPQTMGIQCNMTGGSSGGGWVGAGGSVYSVNSYTYGSLRNVMFGPYQGNVAQSLFGIAQSTSP